MGTRTRIVGAFALLALVLWAVLSAPSEGGEAPVVLVKPEGAELQPDVYSNVRAEDYVGPQVCADCHDQRYQQWSGNLHRKMNRLASEPGAVLGNFQNQRIRYGDGEVVFAQRGGHYTMTFLRAGAVYRAYRITRTIGSRYLQEYVGVQTAGPDAVEHEVRLPFGFLLSRESWLHQQ